MRHRHVYAITCSAMRFAMAPLAPPTSPPWCAPTGDSSTTKIVTAGSFTGANPTNVTRCTAWPNTAP